MLVVLRFGENSFHRAKALRFYSLPGAANKIFLLYLMWRTEGLVDQIERKITAVRVHGYIFSWRKGH